MAFNIPNAADAEDPSQAQADSRDFGDILVPAFAGTGVVTGCAVTAQATPNMTVAVAAGTVAVAGTQVAVTGGNVTITTANATNPRFDLICVDNTGLKSAVAGTPASNPVFPAAAGKVVLAAVRVPAGAASINGPKITDKRVAPVVVPQAIPSGAITQFAGTVAPTGWLLCDGSPVSRATYATLFALVGTSFGAGDGSTTFNVPDMRGRVPVGLGTHADVSTIGNNDGAALATRRPRHAHTNGITATHTLTLPNHGHAVGDPGHGHSYYHWNGGNPGGIGTIRDDQATDGTDTRSVGILNAATGISVGNPTSLPGISGAVAIGGTIGQAGMLDSSAYLVVNYLIKT